MKNRLTLIASILGIVASLYTIWPLLNSTFIKDDVLFEITLKDTPLTNAKNIELLTTSGEEASKLAIVTLTFLNKGDEILKEASFSKNNPFKIELNQNTIINANINFINENSLINEKQIKYNKDTNSIDFTPFTLEENKKFSISFITLKKEDYKIGINGQIENIELSFGYKEKKINKFLNGPIVALLILIFVVGVPVLLTVSISDLITKHILQSKIFYIIKQKNETKSEILKCYLTDVLDGKYSMRTFATEYIDFLIDNKISFYTKDVTNIFLTHKYLFDNIELFSRKYSNFYDITYQNKIFNADSENILNNDVKTFLNKISSLSIFNKIENLIYYIFEYMKISKEDKSILEKSKKSFLGIKD